MNSIHRWRWTALIVYLIICIYDFIVVPVYYGVARMGLNLADYMGHLKEIEDPLVNAQFESVVEKVLGKKYKISVELANSELKSVPGPVSQQSHLVRAAQALGARIVEERSKG